MVIHACALAGATAQKMHPRDLMYCTRQGDSSEVVGSRQGGSIKQSSNLLAPKLAERILTNEY